MSQHFVWLVAACGHPAAPGDAAAPSGTLVAGGASFQAEADVAGAGQMVVVGFMDHRASSVIGADNAAIIKIAFSMDGGCTFSPPRAVDDSRAVDQFDPMVAVGADGTTIVGWFEDGGPGTRHVRVAVAPRPDAPFRLAPPLDDSSDRVDRPWLAVAPDGTIHVIWVGAPDHRMHVTRSTDGGSTFSPPATSMDTGFMSGCVAVADDGTVFVVADQYEGAFMQAPQIVVARSHDAGATFDPLVVVGTRHRPGRTIPRCAIVPGETRVAVTWAERSGLDDPSSPTFVDADLFYATTDGATATPVIAIPAPAGFTPVATPPAIAADDLLHVLFYARAAAGWETFVAAAPVGQPPIAHAVSRAPWPGTRIITASKLDIATWLGDTEGLVALPGGVVAVFSENRTDADLFAAVAP